MSKVVKNKTYLMTDVKHKAYLKTINWQIWNARINDCKINIKRITTKA